MRYRSLTIVAIWLGLMGLPSCTHPLPGKNVTTLPELHIVASPEGENHSLESDTSDVYDAQTLFDRAAAHLRAGDCGQAVAQYQQLQQEFPNSQWIEPAMFNEGICLDEQKKYPKSISVYRKMLEMFPESKDTRIIHFRIAAAQEALKDWEGAIVTLTELESHPLLLDALDEVEIYARKGAALLELGNHSLAQTELENAIRVFTRNGAITDTSPDYYYSMAQFKLAEITHAQMRQVELPPDDTALADILEKKCRLLLDAQYLYTKVIRIGHPHWSGAAAYRTGALYHHLWEDMLAAPAPAGLSKEEQEIYAEVLRKRIKVLLEKAVKQWRRTIKFAARLQLDNEWITQTQSDLAQIEERLEIESHVGDDLPNN